MLDIRVITLFPEMFEALRHSIPGRAQEQQLLRLTCYNPRDFAEDRHRTVDDKPYGGGPGMVMQAGPLLAAIARAKEDIRANSDLKPLVIYLTPQGKKLDQTGLLQLTSPVALILIAGRYEGIDERVIEEVVDLELSVGDYVLSGGEIAAMVVIDGLTRLLPGALGDETSTKEESFASGLLEYPQYTRPEEIVGRAVPQVLLSGNHQRITRWRLQQALGRTWLKRPDLLKCCELSEAQLELLNEFIREYESAGEIK